MKFTNTIFWISGIIVMLTLQSCATIFGGRSNTLVFENVNNAPAQVFIDDTLVGDATGKLILPKHVIQHGSILEIRAEGQETEEYTIIRKVHTWYTIADFAVGAVPLILDYGNGNILRPSPRKFVVDYSETE